MAARRHRSPGGAIAGSRGAWHRPILGRSILLAFLAIGIDQTRAQPPAFPGAEGFGATATGGRGGQVIYVTTLNPDGPGSLQAALDAPGPRTILFKVSGLIDGPVILSRGDVTLAGQSSPGGVIVRGLLIQGDSVCEIEGCPLPSVAPQNFIVRNLRLRPVGASDDGLRLHRAKRGILDHLSIANAEDEAVQISFSSDITIQYSVLAETLGDHADRGGMLLNYSDPTRSFPLDRIALHHNVWNRILGRLPELSRESPSAANSTMQIELSNNLLWDPGLYVLVYEDTLSSDDRGEPVHYAMNWVGNYAYARPDFPFGLMWFPSFNNNPNLTTTYLTDNRLNLYAGRQDYQLIYCCNDYANTFADPGSLPFPDPASPPAFARSTRHPFPPVTYQSGTSLPDALADSAGALPHDPMDRRLMGPVRSRTFDPAPRDANPYNDAFLLDFDPANPPAAPQDSDADGMPDAWEQQFGLNPQVPDNNGTELSVSFTGVSGYTNLECYLNSILGSSAPPPTPGASPTPTRTPGGNPADVPALGGSSGQGRIVLLLAVALAAVCIGKPGPGERPGTRTQCGWWLRATRAERRQKRHGERPGTSAGGSIRYRSPSYRSSR